MWQVCCWQRPSNFHVTCVPFIHLLHRSLHLLEAGVRCHCSQRWCQAPGMTEFVAAARFIFLRHQAEEGLGWRPRMGKQHSLMNGCLWQGSSLSNRGQFEPNFEVHLCCFELNSTLNWSGLNIELNIVYRQSRSGGSVKNDRNNGKGGAKKIVCGCR